MKILITGSNGFVGKNLAANLSLCAGWDLLLFDLPQTVEDLQSLVAQTDFVFHLAGVNRPRNPDEFQSGNIGLTGILLNMLEGENRKIPLVLSSSTQAELDNPYGISKKQAEELVFDYGRKTGAPIYVYRFPNVFGKWCKPNYNSVVATFCHNAANNIPLRIDDPGKEMILLYIDDIVDEFLEILNDKISPCYGSFVRNPQTSKVTLGELADTIASFARSRRTLTLDYNMNNRLAKQLYATFLSYAVQDDLAVAADMKCDERGFFAELIRSPFFGQVSVSRTKPGVTRGNHWHNTKVEKFVVIEGEAIISLRRIDSDEVVEYHVSGNDIRIVDIPPGCTHNIKNTGSTDVLTIFWSNEIFDPKKPDTQINEV